MARVTPKEFQEKHARRLKGATEDIRRGIEKVSVAPTEAAAAKKDKMLNNLTAAVQDGKWERGLRRVSLQDWKTKTIEKGVARIGPGIDAAAAKVESFAADFLPFLDKGVEEVKKMPDITLEDNIARAAAMMRHNANFKRSS